MDILVEHGIERSSLGGRPSASPIPYAPSLQWGIVCNFYHNIRFIMKTMSVCVCVCVSACISIHCDFIPVAGFIGMHKSLILNVDQDGEEGGSAAHV